MKVIRKFSTFNLRGELPVVIGFARTPIGNFRGGLSSLSAPKLGALAISASVQRSGIDKELVEEAFLGNVVSAGTGQAPATQSIIYAGLSNKCPSTTINKVCASGMKSVMFASMSISSGYRQVCIAGGFESMSNIPYYLPDARNGYRMGNQTLIDGMIHDGLWDIYNNQHMGNCGEICAKEYGISRIEQDEYSKLSNQRAIDSWNKGLFDWEVTPVTIESKKGNTIISKDEGISSYEPEKISTLRPAFTKDGTLTAGNSSKLSDGAAAMVVIHPHLASALKSKPLFRILGYADAAKDPLQFTTAPADAVPKALKMAGLSLQDIDYHEINEAFSVVTLVNMKLLNLHIDQVNVQGGAVSLGHPIGCSAARIIGTLYNVLKNKDATIGCASICNGGGGASAIVIERLN